MFIVLEGSDGSGKTTQFNLLAERLRAAGHDVDTYSFPRYEEPSSYFVNRYLNGEYGPATEVSPYTASLFYALDRFEAAPLIRQSLADGKIVLSARYAGSNMAHQGTKFTKTGEQRGFFVWADSLEFQLLGIPRPTISIFLRVPAGVSQKLIEKRGKGKHEHENDFEHLSKATSSYDSLCQLFPKDFRAIDCTQDNKMLPVAEINNRIWDALKPLLPKPKHSGHSTIVSLSDKNDSVDAAAETATTQTTHNKTEETEEITEIKDISLLAIANLIAQGLKVEYAIKWPPKGTKPRLDYYIPADLPPKLAVKYRLTMDKLATNARKIGQELPADAKQYVNYVAPLATLVDIKVRGSREAVSELLSRTSSTSLSELRQIAKQPTTHIK